MIHGRKVIGIIGGMGPMATADLFIKIIENTAAKTDQEHLHVLIDNNTDIPDRTACILAGNDAPLGPMVESAKRLVDQGADLDLMRRYVLTPLTEHQQQACDLLMQSCRSCEILRKKILIASADVREISDEFSAVAHHMRDLLSPDGLVILLGTKSGVRMICRAATDEIDFGAMMKHFGGGGQFGSGTGAPEPRFQQPGTRQAHAAQNLQQHRTQSVRGSQ